MPGEFDLSSDEGVSETGSVSEPEGPELPAARPRRQRKRGPSIQHKAWIFKTLIACDIFALESTDVLTVEEKTKMYTEFLRTRLDHTRPLAVHACAILVDSVADFLRRARGLESKAGPSRAAGPATSGLASARGGPSTRAADRAASTRRSSLRTTRSTGDLYYTRCGEVRRRCCQLCHRGVAAVAGLVPPWRHGPTLPVNKLMSNLDKWLKSGRSNGYS